MTREAIGGHRNPTGGLGVEVYRMGDGTIRKEAHTEADRLGLRNEAIMLSLLAGQSAPSLIEWAPDWTWIVQEDLGDTEGVHDDETFRRECIKLLWTLRKYGIRHGDLTHRAPPARGGNVIIRNDVPKALDFQQSTFAVDRAPSKQSLADGYHLWRWFPMVSSDASRVVRRWHAIRGALGGNTEQAHDALLGRTLLDLGTHMGDFPAIAAADGMVATGVDNNRIRDGLGFAKEFWPAKMGLKWIKSDIVHLHLSPPRPVDEPGFDVVLWLRTWPYHVETHGRGVAETKLTDVIANCNVLFFEPQLHGDGPGPDFLPDLDSVRDLVLRCGAKHAEPIVTLPTGRPKETTVWEVRR